MRHDRVRRRPGRRIDLPQGAAADRGRRGRWPRPAGAPRGATCPAAAPRPPRTRCWPRCRSCWPSWPRRSRPAWPGRCAGSASPGWPRPGSCSTPRTRSTLPDPGLVRPARRGRDRRARPGRSCAEFPRRTGLPVGPLATFAKLLHARGTRASLAGRQWLNLPEYVAYALGGGRFGEPSLRSRTGLIDQDTGAVWPRAAGAARRAGRPAAAGARPPAQSWGIAARRVPPSFAGARAHRGRARPPGRLGRRRRAWPRPTSTTRWAPRRRWSGCWTAPWTGPTRGRLAAGGRQRGPAPAARPHGVMLAGIKTGLLLRRVLQLVGVTDAAGRARLDERVDGA